MWKIKTTSSKNNNNDEKGESGSSGSIDGRTRDSCAFTPPTTVKNHSSNRIFVSRMFNTKRRWIHLQRTRTISSDSNDDTAGVDDIMLQEEANGVKTTVVAVTDASCTKGTEVTLTSNTRKTHIGTTAVLLEEESSVGHQQQVAKQQTFPTVQNESTVGRYSQIGTLMSSRPKRPLAGSSTREMMVHDTLRALSLDESIYDSEDDDESSVFVDDGALGGGMKLTAAQTASVPFDTPSSDFRVVPSSSPSPSSSSSSKVKQRRGRGGSDECTDSTRGSANSAGRQHRHRLRWRGKLQEGEPQLSVRSLCYPRSRKKEPSNGTMYTCVKVDFVESQHRLVNMSNRVELPSNIVVPAEEVENEGNEERTWHAPDVFVVTLSLPRDPNGGKDDGPSYTISMYYPETRKILKRITGPSSNNNGNNRNSNTDDHHPHTASIRLFNEWCKRAPDDPQFQGRFKMIPYIQNLQELGLPSWISKWSGKPLLIKRTGETGFLHTNNHAGMGCRPAGSGTTATTCYEMEVSFHPFPWAAKHAIQYLRVNLLHKLLLTFGFVIEGRTEEELPETLIGLCQLCFPRHEAAIPAHEFFAIDSDTVKLKSVYSGDWPNAATATSASPSSWFWCNEDNSEQ